jgi:uncharacterized protein
MEFEAAVLVGGHARGSVLRLTEALSFWGGVDGKTGHIIDRHHPQCGALSTGRIVVMPCGRGSSSSSGVLAEAIRLDTAPAAILMHTIDTIITVGATVAQELYGKSVPVLVLSRRDWEQLPDGAVVSVDADDDASGSIKLTLVPIVPTN